MRERVSSKPSAKARPALPPAERCLQQLLRVREGGLELIGRQAVDDLAHEPHHTHVRTTLLEDGCERCATMPSAGEHGPCFVLSGAGMSGEEPPRENCVVAHAGELQVPLTSR